MLEDIIKSSNLDLQTNAYNMETFILYLLQEYVEKQGKPFILTNKSKDFAFDAYAPKGIGNIEGETQIEIKYNLGKINPQYIISQISRFIERNKYATQNILIISPQFVPEETKYKIQILFSKYILKEEFKLKLYIWSQIEINEIINENKEKANEIANNLFSLRIKSVISDKDEDWLLERDNKIEELKLHYKTGQFSFFLGAGVSSSAGIPDWNTLINSLFVTYLTNIFDESKEDKMSENEIKEIVNRLNTIDSKSALMSARYLRKGFGKDTSESKDFVVALTKNLYGLRNTDKSIDSSLIRAIVEMCIPKRTGAKVKSIVTYNFDDFIERQLKIQSIQHNSIYSDINLIDPDELPVYHVHGFLPEKSDGYSLLEDSTLVFSEEGYHKIYSDSYHWSNLVQLTQLRENHCIMVGLSMTDPNLRRLLELSNKTVNNTKHFAFMQRISVEKFMKEKGIKISSSKKNIEIFLKRHHLLNEEIMRELGVSVIWYIDHDDIPNILLNIKQ